MHIFLYIHSPYFMRHCTEYKLLALQVRLSDENTPNAQRYDTAVRNCKNIRLRVKTGEYNTLINSSEQFATEKRGCANVLSKTSSRALVSAGGLTGAHPGMKNRILLNYTRIENAHKVRKKTIDFVVIYRTPANF